MQSVDTILYLLHYIIILFEFGITIKLILKLEDSKIV